MPALDLIRPSVTAMRVIASVNDGFARELKLPLKRDTENAKTGQRKYEKTIFRILCVKPPISGGFLSMFKPLLKPFESSFLSISLQELALSCRALCNDVSVTSCATEHLYNLSEIPGAFHTPLV